MPPHFVPMVNNPSRSTVRMRGHLVGEVRGEVLARVAVAHHGEAHVPAVVQHEVRHRTRDQHVRADVELALLHQQRVQDISEEFGKTQTR